MKKNLIILLSMIFFASPALANCEYSSLCAPNAYGLSSKKAQILSNVTGATFLGQTVAQSLIKKELKKATKQKFSVKVKGYSVQDLKAGKFKYLKVSGKNLNFDGIYVSGLEFNTLCDFNYIDLNNYTLKENMVMKFSTTFSDNDLRKTMNSSGYLDMLNNVSFSGMGINLFKFSGANVSVKNNKIYFTIKVTSQLLLGKKEMNIVVSADLKVKNGKITLSEINLENLFTKIDLTKITSLLNRINPLTFTTHILGNNGSKVSVENVNIIGNKILVTGNVFVPKGTQIK